MSATTQPASSPYLPVREDWLARRTEAILEPGAADRRSAPPPVGPARLALPARRAAGRHQQRPQHRRHRVRAVPLDVPRRRPGGDAARRRDRVRQRRRGDERQRHLRQDAVCAGIVGHADLTLGAGSSQVLEAHIRAGGDRFRGIRHITAWDADQSVRNPAYAPPPDLLADQTFREGFAVPRAARPVLRRLALSSADRRADRSRARLSRHHHRAQPRRRADRRSAPMPASATRCSPLGSVDPRRSPPARTSSSSSAARHAHQRLRDFHEKAEPPSSEALAAAWRPTSRPASRRSAPRAACSRATSRSTRARTATRCSGTPARSCRGRQRGGEDRSVRGTAARFYRLDL